MQAKEALSLANGGCADVPPELDPRRTAPIQMDTDAADGCGMAEAPVEGEAGGWVDDSAEPSRCLSKSNPLPLCA